ncbi:MAG: acyltransferase [Luteolibacter sp.]
MLQENSQQGPEHFRYVDGLRGVAVLLVVLVHTAYYMDADTVFRKIGVLGQYGVQLFFVMSAFTLCHSMNRHEALNAREYGKFFSRRFFRIAPLYYLGLIGYGVYTWLSFRLFGKTPWTEPAEYTVGGVVSNFLFLHDLFPPGKPIVPGGWSIGCEFMFYAMFPPLFFLVRKWNGWLLPVLLLGMATTFFMPPFYASLGWKEVPANNSFHYTFISNQIPCFVMGMLYFFRRHSAGFRWWMFLSALPAAVGLVMWHDHAIGWMFTPLCSGVLSVALALLFERRSIPSWLARVGVLSFSIYMMHFIVVWSVCVFFVRKFPDAVAHSWSAILIFAGITGLSVFASALTHRWIEQPGIAYGKRWIRRRFDRVGTPCQKELPELLEGIGARTLVRPGESGQRSQTD